MPDFNIRFNPGQESQALGRFVQETFAFMEESLIEFQDCFYPDLTDGMNHAFKEFKGQIKRIVHKVNNLPNQVLEDHALTGANLQLKLNIVHFHHKNFVEAQPNQVKSYLLRKVFKAINTLLKSAVESIPGGGGIVELKECFENSIAD